MEYGVLGEIQLAVSATPQHIPSAVQRALIGTLALAGGAAVTNTALIEALWDEEPSARRMRNLHFHVSKLRSLLRALEPGQAGSRIITLPCGYRLDMAGASLDAQDFTRLAGKAHTLANTGDLAAASATYQQALSLWRGPALADVADKSRYLAAQAARLDEQRLLIIEDQTAANLAAGRHEDILPDLAYTASQAPPRPRLTSLLMITLYRAGRQAEALAAYTSYRRKLRHQFGAHPGDELQHLHHQILTRAPSLAGPAGLAIRP